MDSKDILEKYRELIDHTIAPTTDLACVGLGLAGEAGESADYIKKILYHGITPDYQYLDSEFGDVLWYIAAYCHIRGITLEMLLEKNMLKLYARYPNGFRTGGGIR